MNLIFLGAPGAGKGTIADLIAKDKKIPHISTGDIFRKEMADKTQLGVKIEKDMHAGKLVSDEDTIAIVKKRISEKDCKNGFILDGFPRTIPQAEALDKIIKINYAVNFDIDEEYIVKRLLARRNCPKCGRNYNLITSMAPKHDEVCDVDGTKLVKRKDDTEEVIRNRQEIYKKQTKPLLDYYSKKKILKNVDASGEPNQIEERVLKVI
jgi:adenylate kinase